MYNMNILMLKEVLIMVEEKISKIQNWLKTNNIDIAYIHNPNTINYLSTFKSDPHERIMALFIPKDDEPFLFVPGLEKQTAINTKWNFEVIGYFDDENPFEKITDRLKKYGNLQTMAIEKDTVPFGRIEQLNTYLPQLKCQFDITPLIQKMRLIKSPKERDLLIESGKMADLAFEIGFNALQIGRSEQEIVSIIETELKKHGISKMSFDTLVLAGAHAADPHGIPTNDIKLKDNELVLFDLGCMWKGYASDATRMTSIGKPTEFQYKIFNIVKEAQQLAQDAVKPGITAHELDTIARDHITKAGYGEYFTHRLGHGIGQTCHEYPSIVQKNDLVIEEGMCFSIEPGIYIPNEIGVRVEDCIYVTKDGSIPLTQSSKELKII